MVQAYCDSIRRGGIGRLSHWYLLEYLHFFVARQLLMRIGDNTSFAT
jgi:hypothetical protein